MSPVVVNRQLGGRPVAGFRVAMGDGFLQRDESKESRNLIDVASSVHPAMSLTRTDWATLAW